jgi:RecA/RadA recombinase
MPTPVLSTGLTLVNLIASKTSTRGIKPGYYVHVVGDSGTGKTWFMMQILAEACKNSNFDGYDLMYDDVEHGMEIDVPKLFGKKLDKRIKMEHSLTVEEMYYKVDNRIKAGKPFIYIVDSMDALTTEDDDKKFDKKKAAKAAGTQEAGTFGTAKAKANSRFLSRINSRLKKNGSILIIISQTRDSLGFGFGEKRTRSGGKALHFYAQLSIWTKNVKTLKKAIGEKKHTIGHIVEFEFKKNRYSGRHAKVQIKFLYDYGLDNTGACIDFLIENGIWSKDKGYVIGFNKDERMKESDLVKYFDEKPIKLRKIMQTAWNEITAKLQTPRKPRYA